MKNEKCLRDCFQGIQLSIVNLTNLTKTIIDRGVIIFCSRFHRFFRLSNLSPRGGTELKMTILRALSSEDLNIDVLVRRNEISIDLYDSVFKGCFRNFSQHNDHL